MNHLLRVIGLFTALVFFIPSLRAQDKKPTYKVAAIGFYNLENLFDTLDNPLTNDADFLPNGRLYWNSEKYRSKQANMAKVISELAIELNRDGVAILGVSEIENAKVLEDLCQEPALKERNYQVIHFDSPDERGVDCGLLYHPKYYKPTYSKAYPVALKDPTTGEVDFTRDILYSTGLLDGEPIHIMVGHWPSRRGGEAASAPSRAAAALVCRQSADSLLSIDPKAKIVIMGDLNDDPDSPSVKDVLGAKFTTKSVKKGGLFNAMYSHFKEGNGTLAYRDSWNLFDQLIISQPFLDKNAGGWQFYKSIVFRRSWMFQSEGAFKGYPFRTFVGDQFLNGYSDHLPVYFFMLKERNVE